MRAETLYVVCVRDAINGELADHNGCAYRSPPQAHDDALALIALLLGGRLRAAPAAPATWTVAVAGGRRTITLTAARPSEHGVSSVARDSTPARTITTRGLPLSSAES
jgi:hypothetical protein